MRFVKLVVSVFLLLSAISMPLYADGTSQDSHDQQSKIKWQQGPTTGKLGDAATIAVPSGYLFADAPEAKRFMELNQNPLSGNELGILTPASDKENWFILFEFRPDGYVIDKEKDSLDADAILESIKSGTESANQERKSKGWPPMHVVGWTQKPFYDNETHNATWAIAGQEEGSSNSSTNYSIRLLGRRGIMAVDLVTSSDEDINTIVPRAKNLLKGFSFTTGNRYMDYIKGDKVASYGLTALIAGGTGAVLVKTGLLAKLLKFTAAAFAALWKFIIVLFAAIASKAKALGRAIKNRFSKKKTNDLPPSDEFQS